MLIPLAVALLAAAASDPTCQTLTEAQLQQPITLDKPCYRIDQFAIAHAPVTVKAGTTVVFGAGAGLVLDEGGSLDAQGTAQAPVTFRGREAAPGYWEGLQFNSNSPRNVLSHAVVQDGDSSKGTDSGVVLVGVGARLAIDHTTIRNTEGHGLNVLQRGVLAGFAANRFEHTGWPLAVKATDLPALDAASRFQDNRHDMVQVRFADDTVTDDATWHALAVPYFFLCSPGIEAHVDIEAGARLVFSSDRGLKTNGDGSLAINGTADRPVTLTGAEQAPGYWDGITFDSRSPRNRLQHARVTYAGQAGGVAGGGVGLFPGATATVQDSEIAFSAGAAIKVGQRATLQESGNQLHDNHAGIVHDD